MCFLLILMSVLIHYRQHQFEAAGGLKCRGLFSFYPYLVPDSRLSVFKRGLQLLDPDTHIWIRSGEDQLREALMKLKPLCSINTTCLF